MGAATHLQDADNIRAVIQNCYNCYNYNQPAARGEMVRTSFWFISTILQGKQLILFHSIRHMAPTAMLIPCLRITKSSLRIGIVNALLMLKC